MVEGISVPSWSISEYGLVVAWMGVRTPKCRRFLWSLEKEAPCGGSSILSSESGLPVSSKLNQSVSASLKQGIPLSHRGLNGALVGSRQTMSQGRQLSTSQLSPYCSECPFGGILKYLVRKVYRRMFRNHLDRLCVFGDRLSRPTCWPLANVTASLSGDGWCRLLMSET